MTRQRQGKNFGFTLVELIVVLSIIAFLATIIAAALGNSKTKAFDTRRVNDVFAVQKGLNLYFTVHTVYPPGDNIVLGDGTTSCLSENGFTGVCPGGADIYMAIVPADPVPTGSYIYDRSPSVNDFSLHFTLETDIGSISAGSHTLTSTGIK